ncbi:hypothetical protein PMIN01_04765 [Paraphaeosphaeria minitans]|uniref:Uncharacterized protein n=1 Tax=Paraphaeosphaeria minitans TaxID=565426 RepID=A0A9P6GJV6_9PLEO|nr:hypothetical protein PMIN01_04765 [Paraphaeosphaeria minitans]
MVRPLPSPKDPLRNRSLCERDFSGHWRSRQGYQSEWCRMACWR